MNEPRCNAIDHDGSDFPPRCAHEAGHNGSHSTVCLASWPRGWQHNWNDKEAS